MRVACPAGLRRIVAHGSYGVFLTAVDSSASGALCWSRWWWACPFDEALAHRLMVHGCDQLPRRRCMNYSCLVSSYHGVVFDLRRDGREKAR